MNAKRSLFFILQRGIGSRAGNCYREIGKTESWSPERLADWQSNQLLSLINDSAKSVPFYRSYQGASLSDYPILTKEMMADHFRDLMAPPLLADYFSTVRRKKYGWVEVTSGGTTGTPSTVIHDADFRDQNRAHRIYEYDLCGFPFGTPHHRLWGSMRDIDRSRATPGQRIMSALSGEILLNAFQMEDRHIVAYLESINRSRVNFMVAYVDAAYQLACFAKQHNIPVRPLKHIMSAAGTLTSHVRQTIESVFKAKVHNKYGSRDCGDIACECEHGGFHIFSRNVYVEVVDDQGMPLPSGKTGRLIITLLSNRLFPMIRVDSGDMGSLSDRLCSCGRPFPLLDSVEGRTSDFIRSANGAYISPVLFRHIIGVVHGKNYLRRFQFIQETPNRFTLLLQPETGIDPSIIKRMLPALQADLKAALGSGAQLDIQTTSRIPETEQGKFRYIINRSRATS
jgi:phenylacetate-CoA ligase